MNRLIIGRYIEGDSWIHRLDPRTKLLASFYFIIIIFLANSWPAYLLLSLFVLLAIFLSKIDLGYFMRGVRPMIWLILFTVSFQILFTRQGQVLFELGPLIITQEGLENGAFIFIRLVLIIMMSTLLTLTTSPLQLTDGLEILMRPLEGLGFPSHELALMLSIALRFVPTLMDEAVKIMDAQRSRGVDFESGSLIDRAKAYIPILVPLFVNAFNRADELATAMEARGYRGGEGRTNYRQLAFKLSDGLVLLAMVLLTLALVYLRQVM